MQTHERRGPLRAGELAEAVVLADLTLVLSIASQILPFGSALLVVAVVPMAAIAARNRLRAVIAGTVAASTVGFLVLGSPVVTSVVACGALGAVVGYAARHSFGLARTIGFAVVALWPLAAIGADVLLFVFSAYRKLVLIQVHNAWSGLSRALHNLHAAPITVVANRGDDLVAQLLRVWWLTVPAGLLVVVVVAAALAQRITGPTLRRVRAAFATDASSAAVDHDDGFDARHHSSIEPAPVPISLRDVGYRYPGTDSDALHDVSLEIRAGEFVAIVGPNGSGKSTLAGILAGRRPTVGDVTRPGPTGLGAIGGTAIVFQRPELQVLGVRVRDDVVWGLADPAAVPVDALLARVGLTSFADRETSTLSGGELQRLAVAAALARRPQLLISDESTAMVDRGGRTQLVALLRSLVTEDGMAVVHITHRRSESAAADRTIAFDAGSVVPASAPTVVPPEPPRSMPRRRDDPQFVLRGVGHVYSRRTPWAHRALADVHLRIDRGEALLVVGHNGSGKSTLAWILAGLLEPSEGEARVEGRPLSRVVGQVGVAFQHARLQLLRPTVTAEVSAASGATQLVVWRSLTDVGFDPREIGSRRVDELSGGEARRVVVAGALARRPRALVLDEPFAGLDDQARSDLSAAQTRLRTEQGMTLVCVSHDRDLPGALVDREVELTGGRITYDGPGRASDHDVARGNLP
jgi:energy-coupling factor transporter ATP-binding protein EcfA2